VSLIVDRVERVFIELTNRCNFDCLFCVSGICERPRRDMGKRLARRLLEDLQCLRFQRSVYFHVLGEPLLHPDVFAIVNQAAEAGMRPVVFTNGGALTDDVLRDILNSKAAELVISMQTINQASYQHLRKTPFDWATYLGRIQRALAAADASPANQPCPAFRVSMGLKKPDPEHPEDDYFTQYESPDEVKKSIGDIFALVEGIDLADVYARLDAHRLGDAPPFQLTDTLSLSVKPMGNWRRMWRDQPVASGHCRFLGKELAVLSNGSVTLCHLDYDGRTMLGTVNGRRLTEIIAAPETGRVLSDFLAGRSTPDACHFCRGLKPQ